MTEPQATNISMDQKMNRNPKKPAGANAVWLVEPVAEPIQRGSEV